MSSSLDYLEYVLDLLSETEDITYKKMMGEYLLYQNGILFGGIYDNRFLVKKTASSSKYDYIEELPYEGSKKMYLVDSESKEQIKELVLGIVKDLRK